MGITSRMRSIGDIGRVRTTGIQPAWTKAFEVRGGWLAGRQFCFDERERGEAQNLAERAKLGDLAGWWFFVACF